MRKIIPFAFAIILVLGGGFYLFTSKIIKSPPPTVQTNGTTGNSQDTQADTTAKSGTTPTTIPASAVNQISLSVTSPSNNTTVAVPTVTVKGVTKAGADVSVNEKDTVAGSAGNFSATLSLEEGDNYIIVVAVDSDGNVAEQELNVTYTPAQ